MACASLLVLGCPQRHPKPEAKPGREVATAAPEPAPLPRASIDLPPVDVPSDLTWIGIGGGSDPLSNQISLAQDLELAQRLMAGRALTLFGSGALAQVAIEAPPPRAHPPNLRTELARLFQPVPLHTRYEPARLHVDGPATSHQALHVLERTLARAVAPLFVYVTAHGEQGHAPRDNALSLWGGFPLQVTDLAALLDQESAQRPARFVITSCFGGGFADLIFRNADPREGLRSTAHCGLFAAPWNDEASGCDPNPDRRGQESYGIHLLHALSGKDRQQRNRLSEIDIDGDQRIGLLEAHTWARMHATSFDLPTTTSERYLREVITSHEKAELDPRSAPEEVVVIKHLGETLELRDEAAARNKLAEIDDIMQELSEIVERAQQAEDDAFYALRIALLERFPLLEHPFEARTQAMLEANGASILRLLTESELSEAHAQTSRELEEAMAQHDGARVERARVARLLRAYETLRLSSVLSRRGGKQLEQYRALRACESFAPALRPRAP
jgi:hypothetical protein